MPGGRYILYSCGALACRGAFLLGVGGTLAPLAGQACDAGAAVCPRPTTNIGPREAAFFGLGIAAVMMLDETVMEGVQSRQGSGQNMALEPYRALGNGWVLTAVSGGTFLAGLATGNEKLTHSGERLIATLVLSAGASQVTKFVVGRSRPSAGEGPFSFHPGTQGSSFYSGHSTVAFAMATALSEEIDNPVASVVLYVSAGLAGYSRVYDNEHWLSDVVAGAVLGIASAKFVYGKWTVFGVRAPSFLAGPSGARLSYNIVF